MIAVPEGISGSGSGRIAQLVEQVTLNHRVLGSSPSAPTKISQQINLLEIRWLVILTVVCFSFRLVSCFCPLVRDEIGHFKL